MRPKSDDGPALTPRQQFENWARQWGFEPHEVERLWQEKEAKRKGAGRA